MPVKQGVNKPEVKTGQGAQAESSRGDLRQDKHGQRGVDFREQPQQQQQQELQQRQRQE